MTAKSGGNAPITRECTSFDADLIAIAATANGDSFVEFKWDANGECTNIRVTHGSSMAPKVP